MPEQAIIDDKIETIVANTDDTTFHTICSFTGVIINNPPVVQSPIFVNVDQNTQYSFDPNIILNVYSDIEGDDPLLVKIIETISIGNLFIGDSNILLMNDQVFDWNDFNRLRWSPLSGQFGANYAKLVIAIKDDGELPRCWSDPVEIIFNVLTENQEPTVSDSEIEVDWGDTRVLPATLFTQDYYDPETNSLGYIEIYNLPPAGEGRLVLNGTPVTIADLPLTVTAAQLVANQLEYQDTGQVIAGKEINITFEPFDDVV
jgi:hypothetical protein